MKTVVDDHQSLIHSSFRDYPMLQGSIITLQSQNSFAWIYHFGFLQWGFLGAGHIKTYYL